MACQVIEELSNKDNHLTLITAKEYKVEQEIQYMEIFSFRKNMIHFVKNLQRGSKMKEMSNALTQSEKEHK